MYESLLIVVLIIMSIFGILQIILFFKFWGMTNDVNNLNETIRKKHLRDINAARIEALVENYDEAFNIYKRNFIMEALILFQKSESNSSIYERYYGVLANKYQKYLNALDGDYSIDFDKYNSKEKINNLLIKN